ncbi:hypothetical protein E4U61_000591 [Claviceps capensis]|nr:hypothetical protein E4U61_000591 [Claviceps capensis]
MHFIHGDWIPSLALKADGAYRNRRDKGKAPQASDNAAGNSAVSDHMQATRYLGRLIGGASRPAAAFLMGTPSLRVFKPANGYIRLM